MTDHAADRDPIDRPDLAALAGLLADGTRAAMCLALLDGRAWTATELAHHTGVAPSTATAHLNRLVTGGLLEEERRGRHRYVRLAGADTAEMIESLASHAPLRPARVRSLRDARRHRSLTHARTCFDHLAGTVAVAITDALSERGMLTWDYGPSLTTRGREWLREQGIADHHPDGRAHVRTCLDWTARRPHLAGAVGASLFHHALDRGWLLRRGTTRIVTVTPTGRRALRETLGVTEEALRGPGDDA
ncbi:ArsR/SmtB family transcription factor [Streptomyces sp. NPDC058914]|uniref:ArsR/SmtB family transcription factor n=1 Tax=Streptomyces TaxID=1883 RepID=UPI0036AEE112